MKKKYPSKIGLIIALPFLCILLLSPIFLLYLGELGWLIFVPCVIFPFSFVYILSFPTYYVIDENLLVIKSGRFSKEEKIDISTIKKIKKTNSLLASPALSLDRIEIFYKRYNRIMISPKDKYDFICDLIRVNSSIEVIYKQK